MFAPRQLRCFWERREASLILGRVSSREKIHEIFQIARERNFHVICHVFAGMEKTTVKIFHLADSLSWNIYNDIYDFSFVIESINWTICSYYFKES